MSKLEEQVNALQVFYGLLPQLPHDPFMLFVWEVLGVHATARKRDAALAALKRIPALTPDSMWRAPRKKLEDSVALAGPYLEQRLESLRTGAEIFRRTPQMATIIRGPLAAARRALKPLPQLGETGAHRMLLFAADHQILPVDSRINRVGLRLGYGEPGGDFRKTARSVQQAMTPQISPDTDAFRRAFVYLSHHGAATCTESDPHCAVCPLLKECPEGHKRTGRQKRS